jgi:hypothetical protein
MRSGSMTSATLSQRMGTKRPLARMTRKRNGAVSTSEAPESDGLRNGAWSTTWKVSRKLT